MAEDSESTSIRVNRVNDVGGSPVPTASSTPKPSQTSVQSNKPAKGKKGRNFLGKLSRTTWIIIGVVLLGALLSGYFYMQYQNEQEAKRKAQEEVARLSNPQEVARQELQETVNAVRQLAQIPEGETPTVATVSDASKLKSQAFFAEAQNGDKVLIFTQAKKAYLYRPSTNKVIQIAPVNIGKNETNSGQ